MHGSLLLHSRPPSAPAIHQEVACIIPIVGRNMPLITIAPSCKSMVSPAPWADAETPTTTPRPHASQESQCSRKRKMELSEALIRLRNICRKLADSHDRGGRS